MTDAIRVTIMLDAKIAKRLRSVQANLLKSSERSVSFSEVINTMVERGLEHE